MKLSTLIFGILVGVAIAAEDPSGAPPVLLCKVCPSVVGFLEKMTKTLENAGLDPSQIVQQLKPAGDKFCDKLFFHTWYLSQASQLAGKDAREKCRQVVDEKLPRIVEDVQSHQPVTAICDDLFRCSQLVEPDIPRHQADGTNVLYVVNAFSTELFGGNPAAVCVLPPTFQGFHDANATKEFQKIAVLMGYSETAFLMPVMSKTEISTWPKNASLANMFDLRWFTPTSEVALCGHATLASAFTLFTVFKNKNPKVTFHTLSGSINCPRGKQDQTRTSMDFPQYSFKQVFCALNPPPKSVAALQNLNEEPWKSYASLSVNGAPLSDAVFASASGTLLLTLDLSNPMSVLTDLKPNLAELMRRFPDGPVQAGISVSRRADNGDVYDFYSRFFAPWDGIPEDPVTGSVHCLLGPYWGQKLNKTVMQSRQCSSRGGDLWLHLRDDGRIDIAGAACLVEKRTLLHPDA